MTSIQERSKLKRAPTDIWSVREQLCLASSVLKSGDQNWISVSRSLKLIADEDSIRPLDWFSQKSCAQQYAYLLENTDIPKRKKKECVETTSECIVRRLSQDRIAELSTVLAAQQKEYSQLKNEVSLLKNGTISDEKLQKMWFAIEQEEKEQEQKNKAHLACLIKRQLNKEVQLPQIISTQNVPKKVEAFNESQDITEVNTDEEEKRNKSGRSSLLTSLLKSPSPTTQMVTPIQATGSPTIASLLCSSPKVPGTVTSSMAIHNVSPQLYQLVSNTAINTAHERPSASAPTLSMLLEQPSAGTQKVLQQQLQNATNLISSQTTTQMQNAVQTRSSYLTQSSNVSIEQVQQVISNPDLSNTEISQIISDPIDEVIPKVIPMDKDEINEIIGDIEELIKEEITGSPKALEPSSKTVKVIDNLSLQTPPAIVTEHCEPVSLSNSPSSEISIEEIDSSTSNIAEIIGTAIGIESKINGSKKHEEVEEKELRKFTNENVHKETEFIDSQKLKAAKQVIAESLEESEHEIDSKLEGNIKFEEVFISDKNKIKQEGIEKEEINNEKLENYENTDDQECKINESIIDEKEKAEHNKPPIPEIISISSNETIHSLKIEEKHEQMQDLSDDISKDEKVPNDLKIEEKNKLEEFNTIKFHDAKTSAPSEIERSKNGSECIEEGTESAEVLKEYEFLEQNLYTIDEEKQDTREDSKQSTFQDKDENKPIVEVTTKELDEKVNYKIVQHRIPLLGNINDSNEEIIKKVKSEKSETIKEIKSSRENEVNDLKLELEKENDKVYEEDHNQQKVEVKKEIEVDTIKKEILECTGSVEELDEEEPSLSKLSGGRAVKTYSKKQNATVDSEPENENSGETADYRAWKKSIMLVYNRLATHKYASIFLRPITEDQAPGYHSIIFRPMDLWTIKKNIDNGTIRSTAHFQRDVMLMFQNAIMFNKHYTLVHKMTLEMQEECLQHMQVLVRATGEASFRRETRTAASISSESADSNLKRKWTHSTPSPHEIENSRMKKRRKSEND